MLCNYECSLPYKLYKKIILRGTLHKYQTKKKINKNKRERERNKRRYNRRRSGFLEELIGP